MMIKVFFTILGLAFCVSAQAVFMQSCFNNATGNDAVSYSYEACLNHNFREIERELPEFYGQHCSNFPRDRVNYFFTSCINSNFRSADRLLQGAFLMSCTNYNSDRLGYGFESCVNRNFREIEKALQTRDGN